MKTSWNKVAVWYDSHLKDNKKTYHSTLIIPSLIRLLKSNMSKPDVEGKKSPRVLDLACGQGQIADTLHREGFKVIGIDLASELISIAKERYKDVEFYVGDVTNLNSDILNKLGQFDALTLVLAIQNIKDIDSLFKTSHRLLKAGGKLYIVMNHPAFRIPKASSWGFDDNYSAQYRRIDRYMSNSEVPIEAHPGETVKTGKRTLTWSFHRPLCEYFKKLKENGFVVTDLEEWVSNKLSEPGKRAEAEDLARKEIPMFMCLITKKA